ncbi:MAG: hypothetical protein HYX66_02550 [Ignavibacteria bacterium]|nr:hypothetical protein [Ignavibacteria bacterium]
MNRERELIDALLDGSLTQEQWYELSVLIGMDTIQRIQKGDRRLHKYLASVSLESGDILSLSRAISPFRSRNIFVDFFSRWSLLIGVIVFFCAVLAIIPKVIDISLAQSGVIVYNAFESPFQVGIGSVILLCLGIAAWLEWSDRI